MHRTMRPPPPPPKDVFFKAIEPEELTELFDDDLEQWAAGGTRILSPSELALKSQPPPPPVQAVQSFPPVAYAPSIPPAPMVQKSSAPLWAAVIGMTSVFAIAAVAGIVFLASSRNEKPETETTTTQASPPPPPVVTETVAVETAAPLATLAVPPVQTTTRPSTVAIVTPPKPQGFGALQTFAAGSGKPVYVDGKEVGVGGTHIKTTCGKHSIGVGAARAKTVDVPCGGTITVGTPDGT